MSVQDSVREPKPLRVGCPATSNILASISRQIWRRWPLICGSKDLLTQDRQPAAETRGILATLRIQPVKKWKIIIERRITGDPQLSPLYLENPEDSRTNSRNKFEHH